MEFSPAYMNGLSIQDVGARSLSLLDVLWIMEGPHLSPNEVAAVNRFRPTFTGSIRMQDRQLIAPR
jgi:hypothetical protein